MNMLSRKKDRWITFIFLLFIIGIRLFLIFYLYPDKARIYNGDSAHYEGLAMEFLRTGNYEYLPAGKFSDMVRPPAYPILIMVTYFFAGAGNFLFVLLWNIAGVVILFYGIHALFRRLNIEPHFLTLLVFVIDLAWILYSKEILTEPIYTPIQLWGIIFFMDGIRERSLKNLIISGLLTGISALIKPVSLYLPFVCLILLIINRISWKHTLLYLSVFILTISPWLFRNFIRHDTFSFTRIQNNNIAVAHSAFLFSEIHKMIFLDAKDSVMNIIFRGFDRQKISYKTEDSLLISFTRKFLFNHPFLYAKAIARGMLITLFDPGRLVLNRTFPREYPDKMGFTNTLGIEGIPGTLRLLLQKDPFHVTVLISYLVFLCLINGFALLGIIPFLKRNRNEFITLALIFFYFWATGGPNGNDRFRLYLFPLLLVYFDFGWKWAAEKIKGL